jgi:hypothetical protein
MFSTTFAPAGTGKLRSDPLIVSVRPRTGTTGPDADAGEDTDTLGAAEPVLDELAVVDPAEHATTDRHAAQVTRASAAERYVFIGFLHLVQGPSAPR